MVGILGILKIGGCYVPIDPAFPTDRIQYMLNDCAAKIVLTNATFAELFSLSRV